MFNVQLVSSTRRSNPAAEARVAAAAEQIEGRAISVRTMCFWIVEKVFPIATIATFGILAAGAIGWLDMKAAALIALTASVVAAVDALAFSVLWNREWKRKHQAKKIKRGI